MKVPRLSRLTNGWDRRRGVAVAAVVVPVMVLIAGLGSGVNGQRVELTAGAAWLPSAVGQVALVSGVSARPIATVAVAPTGDDLDVVQAGTNAYVVDRTRGTVGRVDGGTFDTTPAVAFSPDGGADLQVLTGGDHVFVLDGARGLVYQVDPTTLVGTGAPRPLNAEVSPGSAVVDDSGRLWALDRQTGDLSWFDDSTTGRRPVGGQQDSLTIAAGQPVLVDARSAQWLDRNGDADATVDLDLRDGEQALVSGTPDGRLLAVIADRGVVNVCDHHSCAVAAYPLSAAGARLGPAVAYRGRVFVPDYADGTVHVIDPGTGTEVARPVILDPSAQFDLFEWDTVLFYNDLRSHRAGVVRLDGTFTTVQKYSPGDPAGGVDVAAGDQQVPLVVPPVITQQPQTTGRSGAATSTAEPLNRLAGAGDPGAGVTSRPSGGAGLGGPGGADGGSTSGGTGGATTAGGSTSTSSGATTTSGTADQPPTVDGISISSGIPPTADGQFSSGDSLTFTANTSGGAPTTYAWSVNYTHNGSGPLATSSDASPTFTVDSGGSSWEDWTVTVTLTNQAGPGTGSRTFRVAYAPPILRIQGISPSPNPVDAGNDVSIAPTIVGSYDSCSWQIGDSASAPCDQSMAAPATGGDYPVLVTVTPTTGQPVTGQDTLHVTASCPTPLTDVSVSPADPVVGGGVTFYAPSTPAAESYDWSVDPPTGHFTSGAGPGYATWISDSAGTYTVSVSASTSAGVPGCNTVTATFTVTDPGPPPDTTPPVFGTPTIGDRVDSPVTLTASDPESGVAGMTLDVQFVLTNACTGVDRPLPGVEHRASSSGSITVSFTGNTGGCVDPTDPSKQREPDDVSVQSWSATATNGAGLTSSDSG